jgi:hypothetical protein
MSTLTKAKPATTRPRRRAQRMPYGITPMPLPKGDATVGEFRKHLAGFAKDADFDAIEHAYKSRKR